MNSMKRQKDMTLNDDIGEKWRNNSRNKEEMEPKETQRPVVDVTGVGSKVECLKNNIA